VRRALLCLLLTIASPGLAREAVDASDPSKLSVTVYRDPNRGPGEAMRRDWPRGFAMIPAGGRIDDPFRRRFGGHGGGHGDRHRASGRHDREEPQC
jgi:hypothetical protein